MRFLKKEKAMIRIKFEFDTMLPLLRVCAGVIHIEEMGTTVSLPAIELFRCRFKKEQNTLGFKSIDHEIDGGIPSALFECLKPILNAKIRSYWHGMNLEKEDYEWVPLEGDDSWTRLMKVEEEAKKYIERKIRGDTAEDIITELKEGSA